MYDAISFVCVIAIGLFVFLSHSAAFAQVSSKPTPSRGGPECVRFWMDALAYAPPECGFLPAQLAMFAHARDIYQNYSAKFFPNRVDFMAFECQVDRAIAVVIVNDEAESLKACAKPEPSLPERAPGAESPNEPGYKSELEYLKQKYFAEDETCRGGRPLDPNQKDACAAREFYAEKLGERGLCFGKQGQAAYEMTWHRCGPGSLRLGSEP
jgi:hypothetical protein